MKFKKGDRVVDNEGDRATVLGYTPDNKVWVKFDDSGFNSETEGGGMYTCENEFQLIESSCCTIHFYNGTQIEVKQYAGKSIEEDFTVFYSECHKYYIRTADIRYFRVSTSTP